MNRKPEAWAEAVARASEKEKKIEEITALVIYELENFRSLRPVYYTICSYFWDMWNYLNHDFPVIAQLFS